MSANDEPKPLPIISAVNFDCDIRWLDRPVYAVAIHRSSMTLQEAIEAGHFEDDEEQGEWTSSRS